MAAARARGQSTQSTSAPRPRSDAYVGILFLSLLAQIAGAVFLYLDYSQYAGNKDPIAIATELKRKADNPTPPPQPGAPGAVQPGAPKGP